MLASESLNQKVTSISGDTLVIKRLNANQTIPWEIDLRKLHEAYRELTDFKTTNFKPHIPIVHSPSRGLLVHLAILRKNDDLSEKKILINS